MELSATCFESSSPSNCLHSRTDTQLQGSCCSIVLTLSSQLHVTIWLLSHCSDANHSSQRTAVPKSGRNHCSHGFGHLGCGYLSQYSALVCFTSSLTPCARKLSHALYVSQSYAICSESRASQSASAPYKPPPATTASAEE